MKIKKTKVHFEIEYDKTFYWEGDFYIFDRWESNLKRKQLN